MILTAFGLGFLYFISAIPAAVFAGTPLWLATLLAWLGYSMGSALFLLLGTSLRNWIACKFHLSFEPDKKKFFWRIWIRYGVTGLSLIAPITLGPQISTLLLLTLGEKPWRIFYALSLGAVPSALLLAGAVKLGFRI